ncbi:MAG: phosphate acyltransferase PlsX [Planctomycetota bacterium]|nr:phosphate acyltransferase PlsX [Planctomycetota bacterium]
MRVAVDAMGGDKAPRELVAGALEVARNDEGYEILLFGDRAQVEPELREQGGAPDNLTVVHAGSVIGMGESPVEALKKNPDASILRAIQALGTGEADACIAAGSTGAAVAASMMTLKRLPGVRRPGIAVPFPARNRHGVCLLIDVGANPNCRPTHLYQYAVMGANYYRSMFGEPSPRVALVSIGEEESKGTSLTKEAADLLRNGPVKFVGNVEGRDLFGGACEVAVADGFVGNIILKAAEGFAEVTLALVADVLTAANPAVLQDLARRVDYAEYGGAPLLGVDGVIMICHGRSDRRAIANAIRAARRAVKEHINDNIVEGLSRGRAGAGL